jgi:hypothetical protein
MKKVLAVVSALLVMSIAVGASAQGVPNIQIYFDANGSQAAHPASCPGIGVVETWHVIANNINAFFNVAEYSVSYPIHVTWLFDSPENDPGGGGALVVGGSGAVGGIALGWGIPMNGFSTVKIAGTTVVWNCSACGGAFANNAPVIVTPGLHGDVRVVVVPGNIVTPVIGMTSTLCPTPVPVSDGTWGKVKALYNSN